MTKHILFIVTNAAVLDPNNRKAEFFFVEVAHPFEVLDKAGIAVEFASPAGGWTPYDAFTLTQALLNVNSAFDPVRHNFLRS